MSQPGFVHPPLGFQPVTQDDWVVNRSGAGVTPGMVLFCNLERAATGGHTPTSFGFGAADSVFNSMIVVTSGAQTIAGLCCVALSSAADDAQFQARFSGVALANFNSAGALAAGERLNGDLNQSWFAVVASTAKAFAISLEAHPGGGMVQRWVLFDGIHGLK